MVAFVVPALSHALIFVFDLERAIQFYATVFALRIERTTDAGFVMLRSSVGGDLALHALPDEPPSGALREDTWIKLCFAVDDVAATRQTIVANGGSAKQPWSWDGKLFCECGDPEGNVIQIFSI